MVISYSRFYKCVMLIAEEKQLKTMEEQVDSIWKPRLTAGDPFENSLQRDRVSLVMFTSAGHMQEHSCAVIIRNAGRTPV